MNSHFASTAALALREQAKRSQALAAKVYVTEFELELRSIASALLEIADRLQRVRETDAA
ncbi:MAG TPA: hypothetical protein VET85_14410 [Stellaceae bacterium]|nr:hypothetical protein [Stellaceae bacterium]